MKLDNKRTILTGFAFLSICAFWQMYNSIVPLILTNTFHLNETYSGAIMAADNVLALFLLPLFGAISDKTHTKIGKRMPYILVGTFVSAVAFPFIPLFFHNNNIAGMVAMMAIVLIFMMMYRNPAVALMPDITPKPLRAKANGIINFMGYIGGAFATVLGLFLVLSNYINAPDHERNLWVIELPFIIASVLMVISALVLFATIKENKIEQEMAEELALGEEMAELFRNVPEAIENTVKIAERCNVEFEFGHTRLPLFNAPDGEDNESYFRRLCGEGLIRHYGENPPQEYRDRLEYELSTISRMGYVEYYLIVHDFIHYAKTHGIPVGPGRGTGAGSLAAYCIGITNIDPMKYNLLFERFLNPERVSMPDFDVDFCYERRPEVIDYVVRKYGADHVAQIVTFGTMLARGAVRDVGRAMGLAYPQVDAVAKLIPNELHMTIDKALEANGELRTLCETDPQVGELIETAKKEKGFPRHASTHAAGVGITRDTVDSYVPLAKIDESGVTQLTMTTLEELGLLKMDFLGLRNLTVIADAERMIRRREPDFSMEALPDDDPDVYEMLSRGDSSGVIPLESGGMRQMLTQLRPRSIEDLTAAKQALIAAIAREPGQGEVALDLLMIAKYFERIGDHATNVAEWVEFSVTGIHKSSEI